MKNELSVSHQKKYNQSSVINRREWLRRVGGALGGIALSAVLPSCLSSTSDKPREDKRYIDPVEKKPSPGVKAFVEEISCTQCDRCMPCGYGVAIPAVFDFHNRAMKGGWLPDPQEGLTDRARLFLSRYESRLDNVHQAHRCISCFHCVGACPERINIVGELKRIGHVVDHLRDLRCQI